MSEVIQKYGVEFEFVDKVTKKLKDYQGKVAKMQKTQTQSKIQEERRFAQMQAAVSADNLRNVKMQIAQEQKLAKARTNASKSQAKFSQQVFKQSLGGLTQGTGQKASKSVLADMLRDEDKLAKAAERVAMAERKRVVELRKAKSSLKENALWMKSELSTVEQLTQKRIRERIASARTARQVKAIVNSEMKRLSVMRQEERTLKRQSFLMQRMQTSSKQFAGNMVSAFAIAAGAGAIVRTGQDLEAVSNTMLAVSKNSEEAGKNLSFVKDEAFRLGLGLTESSRGFAKMKAAQGEMKDEDIESIFRGVSEASTVLGLSITEQSRSINALVQMLSKGKISAKPLAL